MRKALDGLVLRVMQSGDNDRRLLVLTGEHGKMWITAKGARSVRSKFAPLCRIFTYANLEFYEKNGLRWLSGGSVNEDFYALNKDLTAFSLASYVAQVADEITGEEAPAEDVLRMTLNTLYAISKHLKPLPQIKAVYELFAANVSGFMAYLEGCSECQKSDFSDASLWLDVMNGAVVCDECLKKREGNLPMPEVDRFSARNILLPLDASSLEAMRYVERSPIQRLFAFGLSDERSLQLFCRAAETYLLNHLERDFETLQFYNSLKE